MVRKVDAQRRRDTDCCEPSFVTPSAFRSQPAANCFSCAVMALRMNMATVTGPTPPGTGVTQLATSLTLGIDVADDHRVSPSGPAI